MKFYKRTLSCILASIVLTFIFQWMNSSAYAESLSAYEAAIKTTGSVVLYIGMPEAFVHNVKTYIDWNNHLVVPIVRNNRTLVPIRFITNYLGAEVTWNNATKTAVITSKGKTVKLTENSKIMQLDGRDITLDTSAVALNQRLLVPIRAVSEAFDLNVSNNKNLIVIGDSDSNLEDPSNNGLVQEIDSWFTESGKSPAVPETDMSLKELSVLKKSVITIKAIDDAKGVTSQGSGFSIGNGLFLTNYHVVDGSSQFWIYTSDGIKYKAAGVVKYDKNEDLAILKAQVPLNLEPLKIGSKTMVEQGDEVVAIGSPEGMENTLSDGIVSALRNMDGNDYIQMTTPITHGSSGSPLFDMKGYVVGVNTLTYDTGNLNFAVAIDYARDWIDELNKESFSQIPVVDVTQTS